MRTLTAFLFGTILAAGQTWVQQQKLPVPVSPSLGIESPAEPFSLSGNTIVVGAPADTVNHGAAYILVRGGTGWVVQQKLTAPDSAPATTFGDVVALSEDTVAIGCSFTVSDRYVNPEEREPRFIYIYTRTGTVWTLQQKLNNSSAAELGYSMALDHDTLLIGGVWGLLGTRPEASVFVRSNSTWTFKQKLIPPDANDLARYASRSGAVAINENTALIQGGLGTAYAFHNNGSAWDLQQKITPADQTGYNTFGSSISIDGNSAVIGMGTASSGSAAYVFVRTGSVWSQQQKLVAADLPIYSAYFSDAVSISGDVVVVGAPRIVEAGSAYVYSRTGSVWSEPQKLLVPDLGDGGVGLAVGVNEQGVMIGGLGGSYFYTSVPIAYELVINSDTPEMQFQVDGNTLTSPNSLLVTPGAHTLTAYPASYFGRERHLFRQWADGSTANPRTVNITGPASYIANYQTQYLLTVVARPGYGASVGPVRGFYKEGQSVTLSVHPQSGSVFSRWKGTGYTGTNPSPTFTLTGPVTETATFSSLPGLRFVPILPCRALDTRDTETNEFLFTTSLTKCPIAPDAGAYSLNVTVVPLEPISYATLWPTGDDQPFISLLNSPDGRIKANAAIAEAGINGQLNFYSTGATDVVIDVNGYFSATDPNGLVFYPLAPCRIADTRNTTILAAAQSRSFPVTNQSCKVPSTARAYSLNFTAVPTASLTYLTAWPTGSPRPLVSTLNAPTGTIVANAAILPAGANGSIDVFATDQTHLVIDVIGYFAPPGPGGLLYYPVPPCRAVDTRLATPSPIPQQARSFSLLTSPCAPSPSALAYSLNVTTVPKEPLGYLTLFPTGQLMLLASTLNALDRAITSNAANVPAGNGGAISLFVSNAADVILDLNGYFAP